jgi:hypothetical protein
LGCFFFGSFGAGGGGANCFLFALYWSFATQQSIRRPVVSKQTFYAFTAFEVRFKNGCFGFGFGSSDSS